MHKHCFQFLLGPFLLPRETEDNAYAKLWGDKQKALRYVMIFSGVVNSRYPSQRRRLGTERDSAIYHAITSLVGDLKSELAKFDWQRVRVILGKMDIS